MPKTLTQLVREGRDARRRAEGPPHPYVHHETYQYMLLEKMAQRLDELERQRQAGKYYP